MSTAPSAAIERARLPRLVAIIASRPLWLGLAVTALLTILRIPGTVDSDVAWQLWIAGRIHAGANLYRDIIETNPPLWFWMALPLDRIANLVHVRIEGVLAAAVGCMAKSRAAVSSARQCPGVAGLSGLAIRARSMTS